MTPWTQLRRIWFTPPATAIDMAVVLIFGVVPSRKEQRFHQTCQVAHSASAFTCRQRACREGFDQLDTTPSGVVGHALGQGFEHATCPVTAVAAGVEGLLAPSGLFLLDLPEDRGHQFVEGGEALREVSRSVINIVPGGRETGAHLDHQAPPLDQHTAARSDMSPTGAKKASRTSTFPVCARNDAGIPASNVSPRSRSSIGPHTVRPADALQHLRGLVHRSHREPPFQEGWGSPAPHHNPVPGCVHPPAPSRPLGSGTAAP